MNGPARRATMLCALLASTAMAAPAAAQSAQPSVYQHVDGNGVDLTDGSFNFALVEASIGAGDSSLSLTRTYGRSGWTEGLPGRLRRSQFPTNNRIAVTFDNRSEFFVPGGNGGWVSEQGSGATLAGSGNSYTYTASDGTVVEYGLGTVVIGPIGGGGIQYCVDDQNGECELLPLAVRRPSGRELSLAWNVAQACEGEPYFGQTCSYFPRLASLSNESDYVAQFFYAVDDYGSSGPPPDWFRRTSARLVNAAAPCDPQLPGCSLSVAYAQPSAGVTEVTGPANLTWRFTETSGSFAIRRPGSTADDVVVTRTTGGTVTSVAADGVTTNYSRSVSGSTATMTVTNALNQQTTVVSDLNVGRPTSFTDPLNRTTSIQYDGAGRPTRVTSPEGNYTQLSYDSRGNVTQTQHVPKPGSAEPTVTTSATFASTCGNVVTCNRPLSTTDARGNVTDYSYDQIHGGTLSVTAPAVTVSGQSVRPQVRTTYQQIDGVHLPVQVSACQTQAACAGTADEVRSTVEYGANHLPVRVTSGDGAGTLSASQAMTYDPVGNLATVDGPLAGGADTTHFRYDAARQRVGTVSPDPDGTGPLPPRAARVTYRPDGQVSRTESGIVNSPSDSDWAQMVALEQVDTLYDSNDRPSVASHAANGAIHAVAQTSYDALGRPECTAQRMNPAAWGSPLPASACTQGAQGTHGPDRISRIVRDAAGQATQLRTAVGTPLEAAEATTTYSANGRPLTVTDGENNRTSYEYDGLDRLRRTYFPLTAQGSNASNSADYEELGYDAAGNVVSRRNRAGETASYTVDALGRIVLKNLPGAEPDVTYGWNLLGRLTSASRTGHALSFTYDALGRRLTETGPLGTAASQYDLAGRRTRLTYPGGGYFVDYDHLVTGEVTRIRENGATSGVGVIATYGYDTRGRRTSLTRGNGTSTSYAFDDASRLSQLSLDFPGTSADHAMTFGYNPVAQIVSRTGSNDAYSVTGLTASITNAPANGLNQLTASGAATLTYDPRGNLTSDGTVTYGYNSENQLTSLVSPSQSITFAYDPLMRLAVEDSTSNGLDASLAYDGPNIVQEALSDGRTRRYVYGPGTDEVLYSVLLRPTASTIYYWHHGDERGSIVRTSIETGDPSLNAARYDEYGVNSGAPVGRFRYTGQYWLGEGGLHSFRARIYHAGLGRFLQTDPIGYGDGMNMYAYVRGDPVNRTDPSGTLATQEPPTANLPPLDVIGRRPDPFETLIGSGTPFGGSDSCAGGSLPQVTFCAVGEGGGGGGGGQGSQPPPPEPDRCTRVSDRPGGNDFSVPCRNHDQCYRTPGARRFVCDLIFLNQMLDVCERSPSDSCRRWAYTYAFGIALLGTPAHIYEQISGSGRRER